MCAAAGWPGRFPFNSLQPDGLVLSLRDRRYVLPGTNLAKIVGTETLPERRGRNLLGD